MRFCSASFRQGAPRERLRAPPVPCVAARRASLALCSAPSAVAGTDFMQEAGLLTWLRLMRSASAWELAGVPCLC
jgi:hypothetical protein